MTKLQLATDYRREDVEVVVSATLHVCTVLGDLMDGLTIIGGIVPTLLFQDGPDEGSAEEVHCGTRDVDIALALALLDESRYGEIADRLRGADFTNDENDAGNPTPQRWVRPGLGITIDFLISPSSTSDVGGKIKHLESDFAAVIAPGAELAFSDRESVRLSGTTLAGDLADREIFVAGPGSFTVLKALAFRLRSERKDAYDLYFVLRNWSLGLDDIASRVQHLRSVDDAVVQEALAALDSEFQTLDHTGPRAVARFLTAGLNDEIQADVHGVVDDLLERLGIRLQR